MTTKNIKIVRKFKFSDLKLAYKVRGNMLEILKKFDEDQNLAFDEQQIKLALMTILKQDQNQVLYVIKNVFRYDRDGDKKITYAQFTNFSVQQHFGQMAIQRLHKKGYYVNGARRIMNLEEFQSTLNYCLDFIESKGNHSQYERLFNQVDVDKDGVISYQDYFTFLREYFGSQSQAFQIQQGKQPSRPVSNFKDGNGQTPQQRFAKLIYNQFKITVMDRDRNKNLVLQKDQMQDILNNVLKLSYNEKPIILDRFSNQATVKYEDFMRVTISTYMSQICAQRYVQQNISEADFINAVNNKICTFVAIKPAEHILKACFKDGNHQNVPVLTQFDYINMMKEIFEKFRFDTRGLPTTRPKSSAFQSIAPKSYY